MTMQYRTLAGRHGEVESPYAWVRLLASTLVIAQSSLLVRTDQTAYNAGEELPTQTFFEDYKEVDGLKVPTTIRQTNPNISFTMKFTDLKSNVPVEDSKFTKPASQ